MWGQYIGARRPTHPRGVQRIVKNGNSGGREPRLPGMLATDMESTRVVSPFASEIKYLVPARRIEALRQWARARLRPDPFGGGLYGDTYETHKIGRASCRERV